MNHKSKILNPHITNPPSPSNNTNNPSRSPTTSTPAQSQYLAKKEDKIEKEKNVSRLTKSNVLSKIKKNVINKWSLFRSRISWKGNVWTHPNKVAPIEPTLNKNVITSKEHPIKPPLS